MAALRTLLALCFLFTCAADARLFHGSVRAPTTFTPAFQDLRMGAGGNAYGLQTYSDGTVLSFNDTYGGNLYSPSSSCSYFDQVGLNFPAPCWQQLFTGTRLPSTAITHSTQGDGNFGAFVAACPGNTQVLYSLFDGKAYVSTNKGQNWTFANQTTTLHTNNGPYTNPWLACDPNNPDTVYLSQPGGATSKTTTGRSGNTASWANVAALGSSSGSCGNSSCGAPIVFDPTTANHLLICTYGLHCSESYDNVNWTRIGSGPTQVNQLIADKFGVFWAVTQSSALNKYVPNGTPGGGTWTPISLPGSVTPWAVAIDPTSPSQAAQRITISGGGSGGGATDGKITISPNNGVTWGVTSATPSIVSTAPQPVWLNVAAYNSASSFFLDLTGLAYDASGNLWGGSGVGVWEVPAPAWTVANTSIGASSGNTLTFASIPANVVIGMQVYDATAALVSDPFNSVTTTVTNVTTTTVTTSNSISHPVGSGDLIIFTQHPYWTANTVDIAQLVTNNVISPPGLSPLAGVWDRGVYLIQNLDTFPTVQYTNNQSISSIQGGWSLDYASSDPTAITAILASQVDGSTAPASSADGGNTWAAWPTQPTGGTGDGGMVAASSKTNWISTPKDTGSNGQIWHTGNGATSWAQSTVPGTPTFAPGNGTAAGQNPRLALAADRVTAGLFYAIDIAQNVYVSTDAGATFPKITSAGTLDGSLFQDQLKAVPGQAGVVYYTAGPGNLCAAGNFWKGVWNGTTLTWTKPNTNVNDVVTFGFGAPKPGGSGAAAIYIYGCFNSVMGFYSSYDGGVTWAALNIPTSLQQFAANSGDVPTSLTGDADTYGTVYVGLKSMGATYIQTQDACPWVNWAPGNITPNQSLTGTVTLTAQAAGLAPVSSVQFQVDGSNIGSAQTGAGPYSVSWNTGGVGTGPHTLSIVTSGNGCGGTGSTKSIPITTH